MRSEEVTGVGDDGHSLRRFAMALASEPAIVAPRPAGHSRSTRFWVRTGLPGAAIAAALVVVAWVATPFGRSDDGKKGLALSSDVPTIVLAKARPPSDPEGRTGDLKAIDPDRLSPYLAAHRDVTPFAYRGPSARPASFNGPASNGDLATAP